jgi:hypothetical protein
MTITLTREEAHQVLDALESCYDVIDWPADGETPQDDAAKVLHAKLSAPEPVPTGFIRTLVKVHADGTETWTEEAFYTAPPQREWQGLTDEDRQELAAEQYGWEGLCSAVEAKLREKNCAPNI